MERDPYESPWVGVFAFLVVAVPVSALVGGVIFFRAVALASGGTPWPSALLASATVFVTLFVLFWVRSRIGRANANAVRPLQGRSRGRRP